MPNAYIEQAARDGNASLLNAVNAGYNSLNKDWTDQTNSTVHLYDHRQAHNRGLRWQVWTVLLEVGSLRPIRPNRARAAGDNTNRATSFAMALDSVLVNGVPQCRVTAAGGGLAGLTAVTTPGNPYYNPLAAGTYANPAVLGNDAILSQGCVPLNPFGTQPLSPPALAYSFGNLDETLRYTQSVEAVNASGKSRADRCRRLLPRFRCRAPPRGGSQQRGAVRRHYTYCQARIVDFTIQYGTPFGGNVEVNQGYAELNLPMIKDSRSPICWSSMSRHAIRATTTRQATASM